MVATGEDLVAAVGQIHSQSILQITAETVESVTKSKVGSRRSSTQNIVERR